LLGTSLENVAPPKLPLMPEVFTVMGKAQAALKERE
jgi:hypothetical protein